MTRLLVFGVASVLALATSGMAAEPLPKLKVSGNKRFLVIADGKPFLDRKSVV